MMAAGSGQEIDEIRRYIATGVPDTAIECPAAMPGAGTFEEMTDEALDREIRENSNQVYN